jgi:hypothetical protein
MFPVGTLKTRFLPGHQAIVGLDLEMTGSCVAVIISLAGSCGAATGMDY